MSDPPAEENFSCGYGSARNNEDSNQQDSGQKRRYPNDNGMNQNQNNRGSYYPKRGNFNNSRGGGGYNNNNRGGYNNNNRGNYNNNNRGNYSINNNQRGGGGNGGYNSNNNSGGNFYVNKRGNNANSSNYSRSSNQDGSDNFDPRAFYHPAMIHICICNAFVPQPDFIQNWYAARYTQQYHASANAYNYAYQPQQYYPNYFPSQQYQPSTVYNPSSGYNASSFQYTPSSVYTPEQSTGNRCSKRSYSSVESEEQYESSAKRASYDIKTIAGDCLPPSPVYGSPQNYTSTRLSFNSQCEDSDSSTVDNFYNGQFIGSQYSALPVKSESGYYSHSPNSIESVLESNGQSESSE